MIGQSSPVITAAQLNSLLWCAIAGVFVAMLLCLAVSGGAAILRARAERRDR